VKCTTCGESPTRKEREKGILDLSMCRLAFKDATSGMALSQKLSNYLCAQNEMSISKYVVTFESDWGMPCTQPELKGQIYLGWLEMAAGYISAIYQSLFGSKPKSVDEAINRINESDFSVVHLMGFDNSFYYAYLYPLLFASLGLKSLNISFVVNEFLLLSGEKFSTSRNHAIWANEVFKDEVSSDWYRFYLSVKKPENLRENYVPEEFEMFQSTLSKKIQCVYDNHMARLRDYPLVGLTGTLSQTPDSEFSSYLNDQREKLTAYMTPAKGYSVKGYASVLVNLIDAIESHQRTSVIAGGRESLTGLRAEHEAIKLLHASLQPIAPNLAECFAIGKF
jgi:methionyl-tRNA synthetase